MSEWISVEDRLPEIVCKDNTSDFVLVKCKGTQHKPFIAWYDKRGFWSSSCNECGSCIVHWMSLPESLEVKDELLRDK